MLFNSFGFAVFLSVVIFLYLLIFNKALDKQVVFPLVSSRFFCLCWDWRFMLALIFSTFSDYLPTSIRAFGTKNTLMTKSTLPLMRLNYCIKVI